MEGSAGLPASSSRPAGSPAATRLSYGVNVTRLEQDYPLVKVSAGFEGFGFVARNRGSGRVAAEAANLDDLADLLDLLSHLDERAAALEEGR